MAWFNASALLPNIGITADKLNSLFWFYTSAIQMWFTSTIGRVSLLLITSFLQHPNLVSRSEIKIYNAARMASAPDTETSLPFSTLNRNQIG